MQTLEPDDSRDDNPSESDPVSDPGESRSPELKAAAGEGGAGGGEESGEGGGDAAPRRRMAPGDRRAMILEQAAEFFASNGPAASTRALAQALGVTQALLYRYFPSKDALVRAVYRERFAARWDPSWSSLLHAPGRSLQERLTAFFAAYMERLSAADYRLWMRAALEGWSFAALYHTDLVENVLLPVVAELRAEAGLQTLKERPAMYGELETVFNVHGALTFMRIRRDIYGAPVHPDTAAATELHVAIFLPGALTQMRALHDGSAAPTMTVPPLAS